jgi:hypothetical protein
VEERVEKWLTRSVVLSLIPIGLNALFTLAREKLPWPPSILIGNGELLLLAVCMRHLVREMDGGRRRFRC